MRVNAMRPHPMYVLVCDFPWYQDGIFPLCDLTYVTAVTAYVPLFVMRLYCKYFDYTNCFLETFDLYTYQVLF